MWWSKKQKKNIVELGYVGGIPLMTFPQDATQEDVEFGRQWMMDVKKTVVEAVLEKR